MNDQNQQQKTSLIAQTDSETGTVLDYLPYIDYEPSNELLTKVEDLIQQELTNYNLSLLHPRLAQSNGAEYEDSRFPVSDTGIGGINLSKYSNLLNDRNEPDLDKMKTTLSYSQLRHRTLSLNIQESAASQREINKNKWLIHLDNLKQYQTDLEGAISKKRKQVEAVNTDRKRKCIEFQPLNSFLRERWAEKVNELVDIGVEAALKELGEGNGQQGA